MSSDYSGDFDESEDYSVRTGTCLKCCDVLHGVCLLGSVVVAANGSELARE